MNHLTLFCAALVTTLALHAPANAAPEISPSLKKMLGGLPIAGIKDELQGMVDALEKTPCGGGLKGCYATSKGPLQLYFFSSGTAQQTLLLVVDQQMAMPNLLGEKAQKVMGGTALRSPIISISTTDVALDQAKMPPALQKVVRERYFNVGSLEFSSGVQLAARADLGGPIKLAMEAFGVKGNDVTLRAAVVMPIPADLAGAAGTGAGAADAVAHGDTMKKAGADAAKPEAFVELQFAPNAALPLRMPRVTLRDATFFLNNALTFGFKGNATFDGVPDKNILMQFQTPLSPAGALDLLDFSFRMATPANFTMEDSARMMVAMAAPDPRLAKYGGGFIRNIESFKQPLLAAVKPLSVFKLQNPVPPPAYRFGDSTKPWPEDDKFYNIVLLGPLANGGPFIRAAGDVNILGQKMGWLDASAGASGLHAAAGESLTLKLGPLGKVKFRMEALTDVDKGRQEISLKGNLAGQKVEVTLSGDTMSVYVNATCVNPFEIKTQVTIEASTDIAQVFEGQGGVNVDPAKLPNCVGKQLEAAYNKIAGEYKNLSGYTASAANAELNKISKAAEEEYNRVKNAARDVASKSTNAANNAFNEAGNAFKKLGKKKKHKKGPDPKFAASVFDWDYYYDASPDLVNRSVKVGGVQLTGSVDLADHWRTSGFNEGRRGSLEFHADYYRQRYTDVQAVCSSADRQCVLQHWLDYGIQDGRQGSADFSITAYRSRYDDVPYNLTPGDEPDAMEHWLTVGSDQGRDGSPASTFAGPVSGPTRVGGGGGSEWTDCQTGKDVRGFRIAAGSRVDGVQFLYLSKSFKPPKKSFFGQKPSSDNSQPSESLNWFSPRGGTTNWIADVTLAEDEYLVQVDYRSGSMVDSVAFKSNKGKTYGPYGGSGGSPGSYKVTPGEKLGCMAGRAGNSIDQLIFSSTGPR